MDVFVRPTRAKDWLAISTLIHSARWATPAIWPWEEHLGEESFLVVEHQRRIVGAFLAWPDDSPVAWVRLAALDMPLDVGQWLDKVLPPALSALRRQGVQMLVWMDYRGWASQWLAERGFSLLTHVITLVKRDTALPIFQAPAVVLRAAMSREFQAIARVDRAAFTSHWWNSAATLRRRNTTSYFAVAEMNGQIVGYVEAEPHCPSAHITRLAVLPDHQERGIGSALLAHALRFLWRNGAEQVTLNTQADNSVSLRLYLRFGFEPLGDRVPVWTYEL